MAIELIELIEKEQVVRLPSLTSSILALMLGGLGLAGGLPVVHGQCQENQFAKLVAPDGADGDHFGYAVSIDGEVAVIGAEYDDDAGSASGSAYVFRFNGGNWTFEQKLTASDADMYDKFGAAVCVSGDRIVIGAYGDDDSGDNSGSAYVFRYNGSRWDEEDKLTASDGWINDRFGRSVSISGDYIVAGAAWDAWEAGSAYVFQRVGSEWTQQDKLSASDGAPGDFFGYAVAICGNTIVAGARYDDEPNHKSGSAFVFTRSGSQWIQQAKLLPSDPGTDDEFGFSVAISGDTAVIGAYHDAGGAGSAYVFEKPIGGWGNMTETAKLTAVGSSADDELGISVAVSGDAVISGAWGNDDRGSNSGAAYAFLKPTAGWNDASETDLLRNSDAAAFDRFGRSVAISGNVALIGSYKDDDHGSAYVFRGVSDCNDNGALDVCDLADGTSLDCNANDSPDECDELGDFNGNGEVDQADLAPFLDCLTGPCWPAPCQPAWYGDECCALADAEPDGDVDLADFADFQQGFAQP